jgi:hypothetical protein
MAKFKTAASEKGRFIFDPPLPNLWSSYDPTQRQMTKGVAGDEAKALYDSALEGFVLDPENADPANTVPRNAYGNTGLSVPAVSLGGFMSIGLTVMRKRKLRVGCGCKAPIYLGLHAIVMPLVLLTLPFVFPGLTELWLPAAAAAALPWWAAALLTGCIDVACWTLAAMALLSVFEHPHHCDKLMRYSHALGIDHVETARHYMESEAQLRPLLKKYRNEGQSWLVQTKIRPYAVDKIADKAGGGALYKTAKSSLAMLGMESGVDMLTIHGVNIDAHVDAVLAEGGSIDQVTQVRKTPSWPRSWANFSLLSLYSHGNARANLHLLGQPNSFLVLAA